MFLHNCGRSLAGLFCFLLFVSMTACSSRDLGEKGSGSGNISYSFSKEEVPPGLKADSLDFPTRPREVLLTTYPEHRLIPVYELQFRERRGKVYTFTGIGSYYADFQEDAASYNNNWLEHIMPGFRGYHGNGLVNVSHFNTKTQERRRIFPEPVMIQTLYFPAIEPDTLNGSPVQRSFYMISCYDQDTNGDGYINWWDLRRLKWFDLDGEFKSDLIPETHNVLSSNYDPGKDYFYVYARADKNRNGKSELEEPIDIFWIDLEDPSQRGLMYGAE